MSLITTKQPYTHRVSTTLSITATSGSLLTSVDFFDADTLSTTAVDGIVLPLILDRDKWLENPPPNAIVPQIVSAVDLPENHGKKRYEVTLDGNYPTFAKRKMKVSIGSIINKVGTYVGAFDVYSIDTKTSPTKMVLESNQRYKNSQNVVAADLVGSYMYKIHSFSAIATLEMLSVNLGTGTGASGIIRLALIHTRAPSTGWTLQSRIQANEVAWSRFYPIGTQVGVEFGGLSIRTNGYYPFDGLAPNNKEIRPMLCFYWETTTGTPPASIPIDVDLTYQIETTIEKE